MHSLERKIMHINIASLWANIESLLDAGLRKKVFVVAHKYHARAIVLDASANAYAEGIQRGMLIHQAKRLVPKLTIVEPKPNMYQRAEEQALHSISQYSPLIEQNSRGNLYMDISGTKILWGQSEDLAAKVKKGLQERIGIDPCVAVATSKVVSKVATRVARPYGVLMIASGQEASFLKPQPVSLLPGVGDVISKRFQTLGVFTMGQLATLPLWTLKQAMGQLGLKLHYYARGIDPRPLVYMSQKSKRFSRYCSLPLDSVDMHVIAAHVFVVGQELLFLARSIGKTVNSIFIELIYIDSLKRSASMQMQHHGSTDQSLRPVIQELLRRAHQRRVRVRSFSLKIGIKHENGEQLELFQNGPSMQQERLQTAIDDIRLRFGADSLIRGDMLPAVST